MSGITAQNNLDNSGLIKSPAGGGAWNFISKQTASADATIDFTSGIDSTYKEYVFTFKDIHGSSAHQLSFQGNAAGGSGYNETMTTTNFRCFQNEAGTDAELNYVGGDEDQAQGTAFQLIAQALDTDNDACLGGFLHLFNPSSTTFVKHFQSRLAVSKSGDGAAMSFVAGYFNTTSAIDEIQFKMASGNIDAGDICLYGISS